MVTRQLQRMMIVAAGVAMLSCLGGVWASYWLNASPAATIVVLLTLIFVLVFIARRIAIWCATAT